MRSSGSTRVIFDAAGAGIMLIDDGQVLHYVAATDARAAALEAAQEEAGQGPCVDSLINDEIVHTDDLLSDPRWRPTAGVERRDDRVVGVARTPSPALGVEHGRQPHPLDQLEEAVLLAVAQRPLGPGQHRVVVGEHGAGGALAEQLAVDPRGAGEQPVGRGALDQVL